MFLVHCPHSLEGGISDLGILESRGILGMTIRSMQPGQSLCIIDTHIQEEDRDAMQSHIATKSMGKG